MEEEKNDVVPVVVNPPHRHPSYVPAHLRAPFTCSRCTYWNKEVEEGRTTFITPIIARKHPRVNGKYHIEHTKKSDLCESKSLGDPKVTREEYDALESQLEALQLQVQGGLDNFLEEHIVYNYYKPIHFQQMNSWDDEKLEKFQDFMKFQVTNDGDFLKPLIEELIDTFYVVEGMEELKVEV